MHSLCALLFAVGVGGILTIVIPMDRAEVQQGFLSNDETVADGLRQLTPQERREFERRLDELRRTLRDQMRKPQKPPEESPEPCVHPRRPEDIRPRPDCSRYWLMLVPATMFGAQGLGGSTSL